MSLTQIIYACSGVPLAKSLLQIFFLWSNYQIHLTGIASCLSESEQFISGFILAHVIIVKAVSRSERNYEEVDRKLMGLFFSIKAILKNWEIKSRFSFFLVIAWFCLTILKSQIQTILK